VEFCCNLARCFRPEYLRVRSLDKPRYGSCKTPVGGPRPVPWSASGQPGVLQPLGFGGSPAVMRRWPPRLKRTMDPWTRRARRVGGPHHSASTACEPGAARAAPWPQDTHLIQRDPPSRQRAASGRVLAELPTTPRSARQPTTFNTEPLELNRSISALKSDTEARDCHTRRLGQLQPPIRCGP